MKTCPVCQAVCFDDMDICYGCLHDFSLQECSEEFSSIRDIDVPRIAMSVPSDEGKTVIQEDAGRENMSNEVVNPKIMIEFIGLPEQVTVNVTKVQE